MCDFIALTRCRKLISFFYINITVKVVVQLGW